jgi:hypothetical protein
LHKKQCQKAISWEAEVDEAPLPDGRGSQSANGSNIALAKDGSTAIVAVFQNAPPREVDPAEVAAAEAHLAHLPIDTFSPRNGLPSPHVMPWPPNRLFVGREDSLLTLARRIKEGGTAAVGQSSVVTGMGGQGKTQLAVELAYRYGRWFRGGVFWVRCDDLATIAEAVAACGPALHPGDAGFSARPLPERVALVASAWASDLPRLLIFDNCEDEAILDDWVPKGVVAGCCLRRAVYPGRRRAVLSRCPLVSSARAESMALLHRHRPDLAPDDPDLSAVAAELGDLPLALELAGSYLARYRGELSGVPAAYLGELRDQDLLAHASLTIEDAATASGARSPTGHERDVARTFEVSLRRLRPETSVDALARALFARAAWLAPGEPIPRWLQPEASVDALARALFVRARFVPGASIPRWLLKLCAGVAADDADAGRRFADALTRLLDLALVEHTDVGQPGESGAVVLHRLVAAFARSRLEESGVAQLAVENVIVVEADRLLSQNPTPFRNWATELITFARTARREPTEAAVRPLNAAGSYSRLVADYETSTVILEDAVGYAAAVFGSDDLWVADPLSNLGNLRLERGDFVVAEARQTRALAIFEKAFGPDHPKVAHTLSNLGYLQQNLRHTLKARASYARALDIFSVRLGHDHPDTARTRRLITNLERQTKGGDHDA